MLRRRDRAPLYHGGGPHMEVGVLCPGLLLQGRVGHTSTPVPSINTLDLHSLVCVSEGPPRRTAVVGEASNAATLVLHFGHDCGVVRDDRMLQVVVPVSPPHEYSTATGRFRRKETGAAPKGENCETL